MRMLATPDTSIPEVQLAVQRPLPRHGHQRRRRLAAAGRTWRSPDGARTPLATTGARFCYLRDVTSGEFWSTAYQPTLKPSKRYEVIFSEGRVEFRRRDYDFDTHTEITVSPEDDIELRRVTDHQSLRGRAGRIEITTYAEVVLAPAAADAQAPAFGNLFVQTEILRQAARGSLHPAPALAKRPDALDVPSDGGARRRRPKRHPTRPTACKFVGRGNSVRSPPQAMLDPAPLSGSSGSVLDPIVAIRQRVTLEPGRVRDHRYRHRSRRFAGRGAGAGREVSGPASGRSRVRPGVDPQPGRPATAQRDAKPTRSFSAVSPARCFTPTLRCAPKPAILRNNQRGQSGLWGYAISGDLPIVLLQISRCQTTSIWCASWCRRMPIGV